MKDIELSQEQDLILLAEQFQAVLNTVENITCRDQRMMLVCPNHELATARQRLVTSMELEGKLNQLFNELGSQVINSLTTEEV